MIHDILYNNTFFVLLLFSAIAGTILAQIQFFFVKRKALRRKEDYQRGFDR